MASQRGAVERSGFGSRGAVAGAREGPMGRGTAGAEQGASPSFRRECNVGRFFNRALIHQFLSRLWRLGFEEQVPHTLRCSIPRMNLY